MTLAQNVVLFPLHRWLDQRDTWRLFFCLTVVGFFGLSTGFVRPRVHASEHGDGRLRHAYTLGVDHQPSEVSSTG